MKSVLGPAAPADPIAADEAIVRSAALKFESLLDRLVGGGVLFDRALLAELSAFLAADAPVAVEANERLLAATAAEWGPAA